MEPSNQEIPHDTGHVHYPNPEGDASGVTSTYPQHETRDHHTTEPGFEYQVQDSSPAVYPQPTQPPLQFQPQQAYFEQYPPPGAGQISPYQQVPGSFPQKDARMYHQQQQPQYPPGTVLYQTSGPYPQPGTDPNYQPTGAQLYPGYGTTQPMAVTPGPQGNMGSVTFVNPVMTEEIAPNDYMCLSIIACLFFFCPTGCAAIYFSSQTRDSIREGDMVEAKKRSKKTCRLVKISLVICLIMGAAGLLWKYVIASLIRPPQSNNMDYGLYDG